MQSEKTELTAAECIAALRHCTDDSTELCVDDKYRCPMWNEDRMTDYCKADLMLAAADALETAEKRIAELEAQLPQEPDVIDAAKKAYRDAVDSFALDDGETLVRIFKD